MHQQNNVKTVPVQSIEESQKPAPFGDFTAPSPQPPRLHVVPRVEDLPTLPLTDIKKIAGQIQKSCFLCDKFLQEESPSEEAHWHLLHCLGSTLTALAAED